MAKDPINFHAVGQEMYALAARLFPITRSLTGEGYRQTLDKLEDTCGRLDRLRFATGEQVFDWTIPREWAIREAWVKDPSGRVVVSMADSNLHLVSYSAPFHGRIALEELQEHLHSLPAQPDAIPYRTSYYTEDWGFCLADRMRRELSPGEYEVLVDSDLSPGHVELGEVVIEGESDSEVLFSTYCCHPSMANNELSGPVVVAHLARLLREREHRPLFTYRFLFVPETIGAIAYLSRYGERVRANLRAGFVVTCIGNAAPFHYKRSRRGDTLADRAAEHVLGLAEEPYELLDFYPTGSDERQYCSPGFNLPFGSLMRSPYATYPEYHTSLDDMSFIDASTLGESLRTYSEIVDAIEANETFEATHPFCEPQLGSRGLYPATGGSSLEARHLPDIMHLLNFCDGSADLLGVAQRIRRPISELRPIVDLLVSHDLLRRAEPTSSRQPSWA